MTTDRFYELAGDLRAHVFAVLDAEPELDAEFCGLIAHKVEKAFVTAVTNELSRGVDLRRLASKPPSLR